jgi:limonene-1,2-epoxide hydrolase
VSDTNSALKAQLRRMMTAYSEGDLAPIREALDPNVRYHPHGPTEFFRFAGAHHGFADAIAALSAIASDYAIHRYNIRELIGEGSVFWTTVDIDATNWRQSIRLSFALIGRWQFQGNRVVSVDEYFDSGSIALQLGFAEPKTSGH